MDIDPHENDLPMLIEQAVHDLYHLRDGAHVKDASVADLEIACDAAVSAAEAYNDNRENQSKINLRWFYICVQGHLLIDLKPELLLDGKVERLQRNAQPGQPPQQQPSQSVEDGHSSSAGSLGRSLGSIENKYGRVMHLDEWKTYLTQVEANAQKKRKRSA
ncbi:hypothetical protein KVR01_000045 [Diaporthe batatas]|uniref:uncharacterized protein n=1 Tax=Diaporthe batatas TaxID=748121 RepID=UPI001D04C761|nr:uncharacterized protein KVR01_000045 [Diaporthe batatas]KAG8169300.1 hypothetical protein KVR01_000045 [Diaporthe batatas]